MAPSNPAERATSPWRFTDSLCEPVRIYEGNELVAELIDGPETHAKGRLIAAAPELYEVLREAELQIEYLHGKFRETGSGNQILARIRAALAKSEGRTL